MALPGAQSRLAAYAGSCVERRAEAGGSVAIRRMSQNRAAIIAPAPCVLPQGRTATELLRFEVMRKPVASPIAPPTATSYQRCLRASDGALFFLGQLDLDRGLDPIALGEEKLGHELFEGVHLAPYFNS